MEAFWPPGTRQNVARPTQRSCRRRSVGHLSVGPALPDAGRRTTVALVDTHPDVTLRPFTEPDLAIWDRFGAEPDVLGEYQWHGYLDARERRSRWAEDTFLRREPFFLVVDHDGVAAGSVNWRCGWSTPADDWEIGIWLLPEHRGRGVGRAAQRLLVDYLFTHTRAHRIVATTEVANLAEQRALEGCGFRREGVLRSYAFRRGAWQDCTVYGLLRTDRG